MNYKYILLAALLLIPEFAFSHVPAMNKNGNADGLSDNLIDGYTAGKLTTTENVVADIEGNTYRIVTIGSQVWMAENLRTTRFNDGTPIPLVTDGTVWSNLTTPAFCWYNNDSIKYGLAYGALYNWFAVNTGKLCPVGWEVPTDNDWTILTNYLGGARVAGGKLKTTGTTQWRNPNLRASNESGFYGLPAGTRYGHGAFNYVSNYGLWWTATPYDQENAWFRDVSSYDAMISRNFDTMQDGLSVRCIKR